MLGSAPQQITGLIATAQGYVAPVITYVKDNAMQVGAIATAASGGVMWVANKIYKANIQKKELETTGKLNDMQSSLFQKEGEVLGLQNQLKDAQGKITTLEGNASNVATLTQQYEAKCREVADLQAAKNELERMLPNIKTAEQMIKELKKVP